MSDKVDMDVVVVGAGVIGLACARALAMAGREVVVLEEERRIAEHMSSRNSEVIHAGLYYPTGSAKAKLCVHGRRALYQHLRSRQLPHRRCEKLIVAASPTEANDLDALYKRAKANDVEGVELIDGDAARRLEPALSTNVCAALLSPETGIFDSHAYCLSLQGELEDHGGLIAFGSRVDGGAANDNGIRLRLGGDNDLTVQARLVVNAAGCEAVALAKAIHGAHTASLPRQHYAKGSYFSVSGRAPFSRLIYPMPNQAGLGVHLTLDMAGRARLGPNVQWLPDNARPPFDYAVAASDADAFHSAAHRYWPALSRDSLAPDYAGVRTKLAAKGEPAADFRIEGPDAHGSPRLINLFGIESPGLTASLAIADTVKALALDCA